jgi:type III secretory pathway component EscT
MKFVIRRAVLGLVALPVVAGTYVFCFMLLGSWANIMPNTLDEVWSNGILIGFVSAVAFAFATQLDKFSAKVIGEVK